MALIEAAWKRPMDQKNWEFVSEKLLIHSGTWCLIRGYRWVFFDNILTILWEIRFILLPLSNKKFRGLMVRTPAFHTEIRGSIPLAGSFAFFSSFSWVFSSFSKKGLSLGLCSSKANNTQQSWLLPAKPSWFRLHFWFSAFVCHGTSCMYTYNSKDSILPYEFAVN